MVVLEEYPENGKIEDKINWVLDIDSEAFVSRSQFKEVFRGCARAVAGIQTFFTNLNLGVVQEADEWWSLNTNQHLEQIRDCLIQITDPDLSGDRAGTVAQGCEENLLIALRNMSGEFSKCGVFIAKTTTNHEAEAALGRIKAKEEDFERVLETFTRASGEAVAAVEVKNFSDEAAAHHRNAIRWLLVAAGAGIVLFGFALCFHFFEGFAGEAGSEWGRFASRFAILGLLVYLVVVSVGNYKAARHNAIVNRHRANALDIFGGMANAVRSPDAKDAVTLTAAGAVFSPQETEHKGRGAGQMQNTAEIFTKLAQSRINR